MSYPIQLTKEDVTIELQFDEIKKLRAENKELRGLVKATFYLSDEAAFTSWEQWSEEFPILKEKE